MYQNYTLALTLAMLILIAASQLQHTYLALGLRGLSDQCEFSPIHGVLLGSKTLPYYCYFTITITSQKEP